MTITELVTQSHEMAKGKGWWPEGQNLPEKLALIHSEISEALEDYRDDKLTETFEENGKPVGFPTELADIIVRVADLAGFMGIDLEAVTERKMKFNATRKHRHGGRKA